MCPPPIVLTPIIAHAIAVPIDDTEHVDVATVVAMPLVESP